MLQNLYLTWFRKCFWLVIKVRFYPVSPEEERFLMLVVERIWSRVDFFVIGAGLLTSPPRAEVTIQRENMEEIRSPEAEVWRSHENTEGKLEN